MTREQKIDRIKKYRLRLYMILQRQVPNLLKTPQSATPYEIQKYNYYVAEESKKDRNQIAFKERFSF